MDNEELIELEDGSQISLGDLIKNRADLVRVMENNKSLRADLEEVGVLFRSDVTTDQREDAVRSILGNLGYEDSQIDTYIEATKAPVEPPEVEYEDAEPDEDPEEVLEEEEPEPVTSGGSNRKNMTQENNYQQAMQRELEAQRAEIHKMRVRELRDNLNANLTRVMDSNPEMQRLLESARSLRGEEGVTQARQSLRTQLEQKSLELMQSRRSAAGTFEDAWMSEEVDKAAEPILGTFRSVIGDIDKLGRSSETVAGLDAQEILRSKPVPEPEWKAGATISDMESQIKSFASDSIKRALVSSPGESAI
jgi:hypothetical protein